MTRTLPHLLAAVAVATAALAGSPAAAVNRDDARWLERCDDHTFDGTRVCEVREVEFSARGHSLTFHSHHNDGIRIERGDGDAVRVRARVSAQAPTEREARDLLRRIRLSGARGTLASDGPAMGGDRSWSVVFVVELPERYDLDLATRNGPIAVSGIRGRITVEAQNGPISLEDLSGDVTARADNGPITVRLAGRRWSGEGLDAETRNGPVSLEVPEDYSATLETGTVHGPARIDLGPTEGTRISLGGRLTTRLGEGGATVRVVTTNGPITVRRR